MASEKKDCISKSLPFEFDKNETLIHQRTDHACMGEVVWTACGEHAALRLLCVLAGLAFAGWQTR